MSTQNEKIFGERLDLAIRMAGLKKGEVAKAVGVSNSTVTNWLQGEHFPEIQALLTLCAFLKVTPNWILGIEDASPEKESKEMAGPSLVAVVAPAEEVARILRSLLQSKDP